MKKYKICTILLIALMFSTLLVGCGSKYRKESPFGSCFPLPPDITTIDGSDPYEKSTPPPEADIYWDNTLSMWGYEKEELFTQFFRATCRLSTGSNYKPKYWNLKPNEDNFLVWKNIDNAEFHPEQRNFYIKNGTFQNKEMGPLSMIYDGNLINPQNLTIVVTDLQEQGLNITLLADLIRNKLLTIENYSAAIIATKLPFNGNNYRANTKKINDMSNSKYKGPKPLYAIISGPKSAVRLFLRRFADQTREFENFDYKKITVQMDKIQPLGIKDIGIPSSASKIEIKRLYNPKTAEILDESELKGGACNVSDRIWNLHNRTEAIIDHLGLEDHGNLKKINKELRTLVFEYKPDIMRRPYNFWRLNLNFTLPQGCLLEELSSKIKNYRYLTTSDSFNDENQTRSVWKQNDMFINRDLEIIPIMELDYDHAQISVVPKSEKGTLESSVICFDLIVEIKKEVIIEKWVDDFNADAMDNSNLNQDKTLNFKIFIKNLLKGESQTGTVYNHDELICIPVVLFNIPENNNRR